MGSCISIASPSQAQSPGETPEGRLSDLEIEKYSNEGVEKGLRRLQIPGQ